MAKTGRRSKAEELGLLEARRGLRLPKLSMEPKSIARYLVAINAAVVAGKLDNRTARELISGANVVLRAQRQSFVQREMDELEGLLDEAKAIGARAKQRGVAERNKTR
jgi:hypothetical protein